MGGGMNRIDFTARRAVVVLATVFGAVSVPWTYAFIAAGIPLWPSFIGSAGYYASTRGPRGWLDTNLGAGIGILYAAVTLAAVGDATLLVLSVAVGVGMLVASLHPLVDLLSYGPAAFLGYAVMFSVDAADATVFGLAGVSGSLVAALLSLGIGATIGVGTDYTAAEITGWMTDR